MIVSRKTPGSANSALRVKLLVALVIISASTLLWAGCKKGDNTSNTGNTQTTNSTTTTQSNTATDTTATAEAIKGMADQQGQATMPDRGNFSVQYSNVQNPRYIQINEEYRRKQVLEQIADQLNAAIAIPESVTITFSECQQPNAFWNPRQKQIVMCYELMDQMAEDFKAVAKTQEELEQRVSGALTFAFIHELGHCLIDVLNLPSTGREEDAVDQLSTFVLVGLSGEEGEQMAISGAINWGIQYERLAKSGKTAAELDMLWADEHSMDGQRFYNILCWVFGHNPNKYMGMINKPLPEARAVRCPQEYARLASAWLTLLKPYLKDGGKGAEAHTQPMGMGNQQAPSAPPSSTPGDGGHGGH